MAAYRVVLKRSAAREIDDLSTRKERQRIVRRIEALSLDPRPHGGEKLAGLTNRYRIRQGRYRIVYSIEDATRTVIVFKVAPRKEAYRETT